MCTSLTDNTPVMKIPFALWELDPEGFHIVIDAELHQVPIRMLIDTGANHSGLDRQFAEQLLESTDNLSIIGSDEVNIGMGGDDFQSVIAVIDGFKINETNFPQMTVRLLDMQLINRAYEQVEFPIVHGVLGGDFLHRYGAIIDYEQSAMFLHNL